MLTKGQARAFFLGGTVFFFLIFIGLTYDSMKQIPDQTHGDQITPEVVRGKKIWEENNCMGCHTLFGEGAYYAPELTKVIERRGPVWIRLFLKDPEAMFPGERKMVNYHFDDAEIDDLLAFFTWIGQVDLNGFPADPPLRDKMAATMSKANPSGGSDVEMPAVMTTLCLACHSLDGVGGNVGPALDDSHTRYTPDQMRAWIADPQSVKPGTLMPQLPLSTEDLEAAVAYLQNRGNL